jgi:hypothetical protein
MQWTMSPREHSAAPTPVSIIVNEDDKREAADIIIAINALYEKEAMAAKRSSF